MVYFVNGAVVVHTLPEFTRMNTEQRQVAADLDIALMVWTKAVYNVGSRYKHATSHNGTKGL